MLQELLTTWDSWSTRNTLVRALDRATSEDSRSKLRHALDDTPEADPLDALRDARELVSLLSGWQWQAVHAARRAGSSWEQIGAATGVTGDQARADYVAAIERQERHGLADVSAYRELL